MTLQVRYQSTGQEWTPWEDVPRGDTAVETILARVTVMKLTVFTDMGQKVQWRRKP